MVMRRSKKPGGLLGKAAGWPLFYRLIIEKFYRCEAILLKVPTFLLAKLQR